MPQRPGGDIGGGRARDTYIDCLVACDPIIYLSSVGEDTVPTDRGQRKGADASAGEAGMGAAS